LSFKKKKKIARGKREKRTKAKAGEQFALSVVFVREGMMCRLDLYLWQQGSSVFLSVSRLKE